MELSLGLKHVRWWSRKYGAYVPGEEGGEDIIRRARNEVRAVHCLVHGGTDYVIFHGDAYALFHFPAYGWYLSQRADEESPGGHASTGRACANSSKEQGEVVLVETLRAEDGFDNFFLGNLTYGEWCHPDYPATPPRWVVLAVPPGLPPPELADTIPSSAVFRRIIHNVRTEDQGNGRLIALETDLPSNEQTMDMVVPTMDSPVIPLRVGGSCHGRLTMDMVVCSSASQGPADLYGIVPSGLALHDHPSKIAQANIDGMRAFLAFCGAQDLVPVFNGCLDPIMDQVELENSYSDIIGTPLHQNVPDTCAIVSSTMCVLVQHRRKYEATHGLGTFPCQAASPRKLRHLCHRKEIWEPVKGAYVGDVMRMIQYMGGVRTTNAPTPAPKMLPLDSWERHRWDDDSGNGLSMERIVHLLDSGGPFVGTLWVCPWYILFNAVQDDDLVYRSGCARNEDQQRNSEDYFKKYKVLPVGLHSVLCFGYRIIGEQLHILVLDNMTPATGPQRWIHYYELEEIHTVTVNPLHPPLHIGERPTVYPASSYI